MISTPPPQAFVEPYAIKPKDAYAKFTTRIKKRIVTNEQVLPPPDLKNQPIDRNAQRCKIRAIRHTEGKATAKQYKKSIIKKIVCY